MLRTIRAIVKTGTARAIMRTPRTTGTLLLGLLPSRLKMRASMGGGLLVHKCHTSKASAGDNLYIQVSRRKGTSPLL